MKEQILSRLIGPLLLLGVLAPINCSNDVSNSDSTQQETEPSEEKKQREATSDSDTDQAQADGSSMIEFTSETVSGSSLSSKELEGKVVLFNYWGTWCPPCIKEIPHFQKAYEQYKDNGFTIVGIAIPRGSTGGKKDVQSFMEKKGMTYPVLMQENAPNDAIQKRFGQIKAVPTSILLDRNGNHVDTFVGFTEKETLLNAVKPLLNKSK